MRSINIDSREIIWVDKQDLFDRFIELAGAEKELSVDLEADSLHNFQDRVCLIQVSTKDTDWVLDPSANMDLSGFWNILEDARIRKIFHDADFDLRSLNRDYNLKVKNLFDSKIAAELLGWKNLGLAANLKNLFQVTLTKKYQRYNWSRRPISEEAMIYAAMDTRYLQSFKSIVEKELIQKNRILWAEEEFKNLETHRWVPSKKDRLQYWSLNGIKRLSLQQQEAIRRIWDIRKHEAEHRDVPVFKVFSDAMILEIIEMRSNGISISKIVRQRGIPFHLSRKIESAMLKAEKTQAKDCPRVPDELIRTSEKYCRKTFNRLKESRDKKAVALSIDPGIIVGSRLLKKLSMLDADELNDYDLIRKNTGLRRWQCELLGLSG